MTKEINEELEKLTIAIQHYLNNNPALLIGSGASIPRLRCQAPLVITFLGEFS